MRPSTRESKCLTRTNTGIALGELNKYVTSERCRKNLESYGLYPKSASIEEEAPYESLESYGLYPKSASKIAPTS